MEHIALDLGGRESQICIPDEQGTIVEDRPPGIGNDMKWPVLAACSSALRLSRGLLQSLRCLRL